MGAGEGEAAGSKEKSSGVARTSLDGLRDKNVMQLKKLNMALFPVRYNDKYYQDAIASKDFSKLGERNPPSVSFNFVLIPTSRRRDRFPTSSGLPLYWDWDWDCIYLSSRICGQKAGNNLYLATRLGKKPPLEI